MTREATLLLLPGNMCDHRLWDGMLCSFSGWRTEHCIPVQNSIEAMARACLDRPSGQIVPIGFSMGAIIALAMAKMAPERMAGIGLIAANPGADRPERSQMRLRQQNHVVQHGVEKVVSEELLPAYFAAENRSDPALRSLIMEMAQTLGEQVFVSQSEALRTRTDYLDVLDSLDVPAFLACGEEDELCPPQLHGKMAQRLTHCELHIVQGAGHLLPVEQPAVLQLLLTKWLEKITKDAPCHIKF